MSAMSRKLIGEILLDEGVITKEQLNEALSLQKKTTERKFLGEMLVDLGYLSEEGLALAISKKMSIPFVSFADNSLKINYEQNLNKVISKKFALDNLILPIAKTAKEFNVAMWDPFNFVAIDNVTQLTKMDLVIHAATKTDIIEGIDNLYEKKGPYKAKTAMPETAQSGEMKKEDIAEMKSKAEQEPIVKMVNRLLEQAVKERVSDIHIDPHETRLSIRYRVDGQLYEVESPPKSIEAPIVSRIKILAKLDIAEKRLPQDGGFMIRVDNRDIDLRIATLPTIYGEKVVIRLLDKESVSVTLETIGLNEANYKLISENIKKPNGLIFMTGPTGSGKTTMLFCILNAIRSPHKNIMTIEDPVEYRIDTVNQVQAKPQIGLDFARTLRAFLRHDPDIIMVGEVRDLATAEICVRAALVGRLVLSTVHTNDTVGTLSRLLDFGIEPFLLSSTLNLVVAQRLIRKLCQKCKQPANIEKSTLETYKLEGHDIFAAKGCPECSNRGYKGRAAIFEVLAIDGDIKSMIEKKADMVDIKNTLTKKGFKTLRDDGLDKVRAGVTSLEEVLTITMGL